ncbi:peptide chain release factor N(5)-glutamine methyltransferase [Pseudoxanthobacter sp. M-2]|uniref:peptide chain release factor N(5)-glutamine methyltransferase n=1 Tax=Pseudoxanthobacter sp. M-2 TaxID=3078754 RepID=UPI0038FD311D
MSVPAGDASPVARPATAGALLANARTRLRAAGIDTADLDARLLVASLLGLSAARLIVDGDRAVGEGEAERVSAAVSRRAAGEPVGRILGEREFWGIAFRLNEATLEPRPDSETIVEAALAACEGRDRPLRILDLGTGTGCLLVALLTEWPEASGIGVDLSPRALDAARANAEDAGVGARALFVQADLGRPVAAGLDLVVSNPPYIPSGDIAGLDREVRLHDPRLALDGGADGLDPYRRLLNWVGGALRPGGTVVLEVAPDGAGAVAGLGEDAGFSVLEVRADLAGRPRAVVLRCAN